MARNNVQTTVTVGMDVRLAKRNAEALKSIIADLNVQLKAAREAMDNPTSAKAWEEASRKVDELTLKIRTLKKVQSSATPATAYEAFISGDAMNSNTLRQAQRGAKNRLNTVKYGTGDQEARQFINDIDTTQKQLNRLQAGFTSPFRTIRQELNNLTGGELQRLLTLLQQEQKLVQGNDKAWANYAEAIAKVEQRMREYDTVAKQQVGAKTLAKSQAGGFSTANERDLQRAIEKLKEYRAVIADPTGAGRAQWEATTQEIQKQQAALDALKQKAQEYEVIAKRRAGSVTLGQSQRGEFATANEADIQRVIEKLKEYRALINDPSGAGKVKWEETTREIIKQETALDTLKQKTAELRGETMSLNDAKNIGLQAASGTFAGDTRQLSLAKKTLQEQLLLVKRGSDEYKQLQKAIQGCEQEEKRMGMTVKEVEAVLDKPKGKSIDELKIAVEQGRMALAKMRTETEADKKAFDELSKKVRDADFQMKQLTGSAKGTANAFEKAWSRLKTYITLYMGAAVAIQKITASFGDLMELSDKMGEVRKTTQLSAEAVGELSRNLAKLDVRTPLQELMAISASAGQLGLKTVEDIQGFTEAANKLMIALPEMGKEAATEMMRVAIATGEVDKIRKQMQEGVLEGSSATAVAMEKIASTVDRLRASSASTAPEITDFVKRVGAVGAQSGISIDQVAALGSTISSLGMRVEMSATALSRMIPAIKNNAFAIANAIGVAPEALRSLFEAGRGMEAILMIFQYLKEQNMNEDSIEKLLGIGGMQDVMKQLNQQGARAGIVFAGLSQNVDELRKQLVTANQAYEENIAITQEFDRMNDTTAARWERLKNRIEEMFVGDTSQRLLGSLLESLNGLAKMIASDGLIATGIKTMISLWIGLKIGIGGGLNALRLWFLNLNENITKASASLKAFGKANWIGALLSAVTYLAFRFYDWKNSINVAANEMAKLNKEIMEQTGKVDGLFYKLSKLRAQEHAAALSAAEAAKAEEQKSKAIKNTSEVTEDYLKKISLVDQLEKQQADTEKFLMDNLKNKTAAIKKETKAEEDRAAVQEKVQRQSDLITQLEKNRAEIMEVLNQRHLEEITVIGEHNKATKKLERQLTLIEQLEANRAGIMEILNQQHLQEVVIIGNKTKATQKLQQQSELITQLEQNRAGIMEILNQRHMEEVVIIGDKTRATQKLQQQSELITQIEKRNADIMEQLNQQHLQEVVVIGERTKAAKALQQQSELITQLEERRLETMEFMNQVHLQEVVVIGQRAKATKNLEQQFNLISQLEERRAGIMEQLNQQHLQEVEVIGDKSKAMQGLQQQSMLITQLDQQRTELMEVLNQKHLQEVVVIGKRKQAEESLAKQSTLVQMLEKQQAEVTDVLTFKTKDLSAETKKLTKNEEDVAEQATKVEAGMRRVNIEGNKSAAVIRDINSKYGQYLGYMLSETSSAQQLAAARELINKKLRETITLKQQEAALGSVEQEYGGNVNKKGSSMEKTINSLFGKNYDAAARVSVAINEAAQKFTKDSERYEDAVRKIISDNFKYIDRNGQIAKQFSDDVVQDRLTSKILGKAKDYREAIEEYTEQEDAVNRRFEARTNVNRKQTREAVAKDLNEILGDWKDLVEQYRKAEGEEKEKLAAEVYKQQRSYANAVANNAEYFNGDNRKAVYEKNIANMKTYEKGLRDVAGEAIRTIDAMERAEGKITGLDLSNEGNSANNPWGGSQDAASTDWKNMTANQLVERRKQMKEFVNAIQTDTDVQSVLKEDAALKKAIESGMSADMRTVIEWYNTERLKIQDELHARHLTNTGDWMDPKKQKNAHKQFQNEVKAYLEELDAYYTERSQEIQTARNNEEITEAEAWRRTIKNETEWYNRRAELQKLYGEKGAEVTKEEQDAIFAIIAERTGDSTTFIQQMIGKTIQFAKQIEKTGDKGAAIVHKWRADLGLGWEKDFLKSAKSIGKLVKFIEDTLAKERPYDGITKNLQENLDKMGILAAQYKRINDELTAQGKDAKYSNAEISAQTYKEMAFYLKQAEEAWSIDIEELLRRMAEEGMVATAEEISKNELLKQAVMGQLRKTFEEVQNAVKKEASQIKKDVDILWNDDTRGPGGMSMKSAYDQAIARLGMQQDSVSRANSLIGAGAASDNVAARLAVKQIEVQIRMQKAQFDMYRVQANQRIDALKREATEHRRLAALADKEGDKAEKELELLKAANAERDAENVRKSLGLTLTEETKKEEENIANLLKLQEESQNRLYQSLREWADLLASSVQSLFEASNAGNAEYYNELAKMNLTGKGGPGAGTYIVIDNEGTSDATAHYEYLDERQALERQREIEQQNALADAWRKVMDDLNQKMNDQITDWINAALQNASIDANTVATRLNTDELIRLREQMATGGGSIGGTTIGGTTSGNTTDGNTTGGVTDMAVEGGDQSVMFGGGVNPGVTWMLTDEQLAAEQAQLDQRVQMQKDGIDKVEKARKASFTRTAKEERDTDGQITKSNASMFAKMTMAANLYGVAYQAMSNENLSTTQKFEMMALQSVGNFAISSLTSTMAEAVATGAVSEATVLGKLWSQLGWAAAPVFAIFTGLLGAAMGAATSAVTKSKSQIAQATGSSVSAGRLATGMLKYAEGNVNELTDPATLTPGRSYNVDAADGRTYRAKYTGTNPKTHITSGPEFHLVGEAGREAIIDAHTTRNIQMNEPEIWSAIKTLYNGGTLGAQSRRRTRRGVAAFADGNVEDFEEMGVDGTDAYGTTGFTPEMAQRMMAALDRNSEVMELIAANGIEAFVSPYGPRGVVAGYDKAKKEAMRHGEKFL